MRRLTRLRPDGPPGGLVSLVRFRFVELTLPPLLSECQAAVLLMRLAVRSTVHRISPGRQSRE